VNDFPSGAALLSYFLADKGYSYGLQKVYRKSHWLRAIGTGAMIRSGEKPTIEYALYALQTQAGTAIYPGGRTALSLLNKAHYLELSIQKITLIGGRKDRLPSWFREYDWDVNVAFHQLSMIPPDMNMREMDQNSFTVKISDPVRALMECLYLATDEAALTECYELIEELNSLIPAKVQLLLENCSSIKVKRFSFRNYRISF